MGKNASELVLFGHPFSSYCQKVLIALRENPIPFELRLLGGDERVWATELSTSMPIASSMPIIVRMLSVKPRKYIAPSVTSSEAGTASETISVVGR